MLTCSPHNTDKSTLLCASQTTLEPASEDFCPQLPPLTGTGTGTGTGQQIINNQETINNQGSKSGKSGNNQGSKSAKSGRSEKKEQKVMRRRQRGN